MGLDMYLKGDKYYRLDSRPKEDGFEVSNHTLQLGYWRKHPNLHGFIVTEFADGKDECREIELGEQDILKIIEAVKHEKLPETEGFFFGHSDGSEKAEDLAIFEKALAWLREEPKHLDHWRSVIYEASW